MDISSVYVCVSPSLCVCVGSTAAKQRQEVWRTKRVFFLTPQVMVNDLSRETCPARQVKCVVIDEAHKALGNHAYCQVNTDQKSQPLPLVSLAGYVLLSKSFSNMPLGNSYSHNLCKICLVTKASYNN